MRNIIPKTLLRAKARNFSPNMEHQMLEEENERAFLEWCRAEENKPTLADTLWYSHTPWWKRVLDEITHLAKP